MFFSTLYCEIGRPPVFSGSDQLSNIDRSVLESFVNVVTLAGAKNQNKTMIIISSFQR
mgnify:FL=1